MVGEKYTKGEWEYDGKSIICNNKMIAVLGKVGQITSDEDDANANLIASAPNMHKELESGKEWLSKFVMRFYIAAETPTYERMKPLYQELDEFQRTFGLKALAKAEGK